uniref:Uncharacterized protein n=1 Tax=Cacopsylla melanoneura TaxID=428564 RepID=A0A8D8RK07_9HEMI
MPYLVRLIESPVHTNLPWGSLSRPNNAPLSRALLSQQFWFVDGLGPVCHWPANQYRFQRDFRSTNGFLFYFCFRSVFFLFCFFIFLTKRHCHFSFPCFYRFPRERKHHVNGIFDCMRTYSLMTII